MKIPTMVLTTVGVVATVVLVSVAKVGDAKERKEETIKRVVIGNCWNKRYKSLDPAEQRLTAGICEKMEREFVRDYGTSPYYLP